LRGGHAGHRQGRRWTAKRASGLVTLAGRTYLGMLKMSSSARGTPTAGTCEGMLCTCESRAGACGAANHARRNRACDRPCRPRPTLSAAGSSRRRRRRCGKGAPPPLGVISGACTDEPHQSRQLQQACAATGKGRCSITACHAGLARSGVAWGGAGSPTAAAKGLADCYPPGHTPSGCVGCACTACSTNRSTAISPPALPRWHRPGRCA
jgi:hypothetical protein